MAFGLNNGSASTTLHLDRTANACGVRAHRKQTEDPQGRNRPVEETTVEQTPDGAFRRQRNEFTVRFGSQPGQAPAEPGRYHVLGATGCGWNRRQRIVIRLLGLWDVFTPEIIYGRDEHGWKLTQPEGGVAEKFGYERLNDAYKATEPNYRGRATSPTVIDMTNGKVVTNNYHILSIDLETAFKPFRKPGAPDLYPEDLRQKIDLLNQQIFDDVHNGTYKVNFATSKGAAKAAYEVFKARLADYDFRLASRRYLFGPNLTDSDVRLFQTLESYEIGYRPEFLESLGLSDDEVVHVWDYPNLFAYARDPFSPADHTLQSVKDERKALYERWLEPAGCEVLSGSPYYSGPGVGGSFELWQFGPESASQPFRG